MCEDPPSWEGGSGLTGERPSWMDGLEKGGWLGARAGGGSQGGELGACSGGLVTQDKPWKGFKWRGCEASVDSVTGRSKATAVVQGSEDGGPDQVCGLGLRGGDNLERFKGGNNLERFKGEKGLGLLMAGR